MVLAPVCLLLFRGRVNRVAGEPGPMWEFGIYTGERSFNSDRFHVENETTSITYAEINGLHSMSRKDVVLPC